MHRLHVVIYKLYQTTDRVNGFYQLLSFYYNTLKTEQKIGSPGIFNN